MRFFVLIALLATAACGKEIGDECVVSSDCSSDGTRFCDTSQKSGYCTIQGCDVDTCPDEAVCVRFFTGSFSNKPCNPATENTSTDDCSLDELCTLDGHCAPRSSELRYCMKQCDSNSDCRDGYECRDFELMREHGGEPVLANNAPVTDTSPKFCAISPN